ncbi:MAG: tetratricopeptide repeat protein [Casimicrobiaceae bacterium]
MVSEAQLELGVMYATGDGAKRDDKMAVALFQKAATQGEVTAQYDLELIYAKCNGVQKDYAQAVAWFRKAADQGMSAISSNWGWFTKMARPLQAQPYASSRSAVLLRAKCFRQRPRRTTRRLPARWYKR